jgi:hypothetical protein
LSIRQQELELERTRLAIEFAKYGFAGTLTAAIVGAVVILGLAIISASTPFKIETWGLVAIAVVIMIGAVAFGYLSLWELPRVFARIKGLEFSVVGGQAQRAQDRADASRRRRHNGGAGAPPPSDRVPP